MSEQDLWFSVEDNENREMISIHRDLEVFCTIDFNYKIDDEDRMRVDLWVDVLNQKVK